jgi:hypothetical protein
MAGMVASLAALALHAYAILFPVLLLDDFPHLLHSWTWSATTEHLWTPHNEHTMPLGRLSIWALVQLGGGRLTAMPGLTALQGPLALILGMWLLYFLVRRETGNAVHGLLAMTFFGVSTRYNNAVGWFSASFAVLAVDTTLLALLAAQRWRQTGRCRHLAVCVFWVALAPGWFASGILAGPLCCLYLMPGRWWNNQNPPVPARECPGGSRRPLVLSLVFACVPLVGSLIFLGVLLPRADTAQRIIHAGHYGGNTVFEAFQPLMALGYTARALVDHVLIGTFGIWNMACPKVLVPVGLAILGLGASWWWRRAPHRRLLLLGLGFILFNYLLIYSFRSGWSYEGIRAWNRYQLLPHLGLTLVLAGGLPAWLGRRGGCPDSVLSRRQALSVCLLAGALFAIQLPWGLGCPFNTDHATQMPALRRVEEIGARCRMHRIAAATAHEALGRLDLPYDDGTGNGWKFLRGSDDPLPFSVDEARRLLDR